MIGKPKFSQKMADLKTHLSFTNSRLKKYIFKKVSPSGGDLEGAISPHFARHKPLNLHPQATDAPHQATSKLQGPVSKLHPSHFDTG